MLHMQTAARPRALLLNGVLMSTCFAGLEGCIIVTINLSAAIVPPEVAATSNGVLYLCFSLMAFAAPPIVERLSAKWCMISSMALYSLYLASFILANPTMLLVSAAVGGCAGSLLWVAQGVYFTRNALAYDVACAAGGGTFPCSFLGGDSITAFAGLFAICFQLVTTLAKPTAAVLLTIYPNDRTTLFGILTAAAISCTLLMLLILPLRDEPRHDDLAATAAATAAAGAPTAASAQQPPPPSPSFMSPPSPPPSEPPMLLRPTSAVDSGSGRGCQRCLSDRNSNLLLLLLDPRALLLTPYNAAFGVATSFFPTHITVLTNEIFDRPGESGAAAVGWMYTIAGATSAVIAATAAVGAQRFRWARPITMLLGSAAFVAASLLSALGGREEGPGCPCFTYAVLGGMYVCYGVGVAAWQGSCMAMVGDLFRDDPRAAFAHLKFTSGICSFVGFFVLPKLSLRRAALVTAGTSACGALGLVALLAMQEQLQERSLRTTAAPIVHARSIAVQEGSAD